MELNLKWRGKAPRPPMRTLPELAEEFGVTTSTLSAYMQHHNGPKSTVKHNRTATRSPVTYYDPGPVRKWWKELKEKQA